MFKLFTRQLLSSLTDRILQDTVLNLISFSTVYSTAGAIAWIKKYVKQVSFQFPDDLLHVRERRRRAVPPPPRLTALPPSLDRDGERPEEGGDDGSVHGGQRGARLKFSFKCFAAVYVGNCVRAVFMCPNSKVMLRFKSSLFRRTSGLSRLSFGELLTTLACGLHMWFYFCRIA